VYNKLFTKILDSSIWLESTPTRIVWLTMIAVMDEDGFAQFAAPKNVAHRARVTPEEAEEALRILENPDIDSSNPDNEGRRLERVPGGWLVLNADKHRQLVTRLVDREQNRIRVQRHRDKKRSTITEALPVTRSNASEAEAETEAHSETKILVTNNKLDTEAGAATKATTGGSGSSPAATHKPTTKTRSQGTTDGRSKHPVFVGQRFVVFDWQVEDLSRLLGPHLESFELDMWFPALDAATLAAGEAVPQRDGGKWLQARCLEEAERRGIAIGSGKPNQKRRMTTAELTEAVRADMRAAGELE
jgi:hypothetical protein